MDTSTPGPVLALVGAPSSGRSTVTAILSDLVGAKRCAFGDELDEALVRIAPTLDGSTSLSERRGVREAARSRLHGAEVARLRVGAGHVLRGMFGYFGDLGWASDKLLDALDPRLGGSVFLDEAVALHGWDRLSRHRVWGPEHRALRDRLGEGLHRISAVQEWYTLVYEAVCADPASLTIVPDVNHPDELEFVRQVGAVVWRVRRAGPLGSHARARETFHDAVEVDAEIVNDSSLEVLIDRVRGAYNDRFAHPGSLAEKGTR